MKKKYIYTIEINDIGDEVGLYDERACQSYESLDDAVETARKIADEYVSSKSAIEVTVYSGEYEDESGNVFGEPADIYCATNLSVPDSMEARMRAGYENLLLDYYSGDRKVDWEYTEYGGEKFRSAVVTSPFRGDNCADMLIVDASIYGVMFDQYGDPVDKEAAAFDSLVTAYVPGDWFDLSMSEFIGNIKRTFN